jgi:hypothetical protein
MPYAVANDAASLAGLQAGDVTAAHATLADDIVDSLMNRVPDGFNQVTASAESHTVRIAGTRELLLNHHPVISITTVVVDARASNPTTLNSGNYREENGILKLVTPAAVNAGIEWVSSWPVGIEQVDVTYEYGYSSTPALIVQLANIIAGEIGKKANQAANQPASGASKVRIGDFEEQYASGSMDAITQMLTETGKVILAQANLIYREYRY